jgi:DNA processing protein
VDLHDAVALSLLAGLSRRRLADRLRRRPSSSHLSPVSRPSTHSPIAHERLRDVVRAAARRPIANDRLDLARSAADRALVRAAACGATPLLLGSATYPAALEAIIDPPVVLWTRGCLGTQGSSEAGDDPAVAIVGARAATAYARDMATRLGTDLANQGVTVVSGLARGVDVAAHRGALHSTKACCTLAVFGCGIDVIYPREHASVAAAIAERGALLSEFPPGATPRPEFFPRRNRLVSGLSRAVVVVEAAARSGALITADCALEQGRDVLAVPGNVLSGRNRGAHALLRDGAKIVEDADDILEELGLPPTERRGSRGADDRTRDAVLRCMDPGDGYELDELARESSLAPAALLPRLLELELAGDIRRDGARFVRVTRGR